MGNSDVPKSRNGKGLWKQANIHCVKVDDKILLYLLLSVDALTAWHRENDIYRQRAQKNRTQTHTGCEPKYYMSFHFYSLTGNISTSTANSQPCATSEYTPANVASHFSVETANKAFFFFSVRTVGMFASPVHLLENFHRSEIQFLILQRLICLVLK